MNRLPLKRISEYGYFQRLWESPTLWILYFFVLFGWNINNVLQIKPPACFSFHVSVACSCVVMRTTHRSSYDRHRPTFWKSTRAYRTIWITQIGNTGVPLEVDILLILPIISGYGPPTQNHVLYNTIVRWKEIKTFRGFSFCLHHLNLYSSYFLTILNYTKCDCLTN